jgi:hypothetical protein
MLGSMASIRYFSHTHYTNSSMFELVVDKFTIGSPYTTIVGRRRDGQFIDGGYTHGEIIHQEPRTTHLCQVFPDDLLFRKTLTSAVKPTKVHHQKLMLSLGPYRLANTDDYQMADVNELVLSQWMIEHLIGPCAISRDFQDKLHGLLTKYVSTMADKSCRPDNDAPASKIPRDKWLIIRQWAWELYELRNSITHGSDWHTKPWRWSIFEHCLFAAWIYPLLVKLIFEAEGDYSLNPYDKAALGAVDGLLVDRHWKDNWNQILADSLLKRGIDAAVENCFAKHGDEIQKKLDALGDLNPNDVDEKPYSNLDGNTA